MNDDATLAAIAARFRVQGEFIGAERYGTGHINETYLGRYRTKNGQRRYIHQRINDRIFSDILSLMSNVGRVTRHVRAKLEAADAGEIDRRVLSLVPTVVETSDGADVLRAQDGSWWRTYVFIDRARTYDTIQGPVQAYQASRAFGKFVASLADLPGERLHETIPAFHDTNKRLADLVITAERDAMNRAKDVGPEIEYCLRNAGLADSLSSLQRAGIARECVTHNDTKLNNVMIDDVTGEGVCVIDLDTVMPGIALFDFGDMVRTATMPVAEDERDISLVQASAEMFEALARGFIEGAGSLLASAEREHLVAAGKVMTFECGIRFLTDYLQGDRYFRTHRPKQNIDRARTQFALLESLSRQEERLCRAVADLALP